MRTKNKQIYTKVCNVTTFAIDAYIVFDEKIAKEFHDCAEKTKEYPQDYGEMRRLRIELQRLCGITELEALNVLINRNVSDYVWKYNTCTTSGLPARKERSYAVL